MSWIGTHLDTCRDDEQYITTLKNHNYFAWNIYYDHQIESINRQINELNRQMQQINTMSLTATAAMSPYQRTTNSFLASNDLLSLGMAQQMNGIMKGYSRGIQKNSNEVRQIQNKLKRAEDRKRSLIRMDGNIMQNKETWKQSQLSQQIQSQQSHSNQLANNNHNVNTNMQNIQNQMKQLENMQNVQNQMMTNVLSHILQNDDDSEHDDDEDMIPETEELRKWFDNVLKLPQYFQIFVDNGFEDLDSISDMTMDDLTQIKITKLGHQKKLSKKYRNYKNMIC
eukprot:598666_1